VITYGCLIAPRDLLERILDTNQKSGVFAGLELTSEGVLVATTTTIDSKEVVSTNARILPHRAAIPTIGRFKNELAPWKVVDTGFHKKYPHRHSLSSDEYRQAINISVPENVIFCGAIEYSDDGPILTSKLIVSTSPDRFELYPCESVILEPEANPLRRLPPELVDGLQKKKVMVVGLGSGGSEIALNLACSGIGSLVLIDRDRLRPENYIRFSTTKQDLGRLKVDVVRSMIKERELRTDVDVHNLDVVYDADEFRGLIGSSVDLIICATDSVLSRRLVNCVAVQMGIECVIAGTLNGGKIGEVLRILPFSTACYECVRKELGAALEQPSADDRATTPYADPNPQENTATAIRPDVGVPAALATYIALQALHPDLYVSAPTSYVVWGRDSDSRFASPFQFDYPFGANFVAVKRQIDCPICGSLPDQLAGVDVPKRVGEILSQADMAES
jgi:molybdopterin/thiamine biosynthesis adenylyltransferase